MTTATAKEPKFDQDQMLKMVEQKYPDKWGYSRKIAYLFDNYFRINYFCHEKGNAITESHFVLVTPDGIIERE